MKMKSKRNKRCLAVICCVILILPGTPQAMRGYCSFPPFLWTPVLSNGNDNQINRNRKWLSGVEYRENSDTWSKQKEITVEESEIIIHHKIHLSCDDSKGRKSTSCYKQNLIYRIICVQEEADGKYRIQKENDGKFQFGCLKFVQKEAGVVQVYSASPKDKNHAQLCNIMALHRQEWPWIDPNVTSWLPCPLVGGYDFRASHLRSKSKESCSEDWLPSRMESECIMGEGIIFTFPNATCNPFNSTRHEQHVQCRAVWIEKPYTFYLLSEGVKTPRYILRTPSEISTRMKAYLYLSAVAPMSGLGLPPGDVMAVSMQMRQSDSGTCYDESESCELFAQQGKCKNTAFHTFASHCVKSCGLCDVTPKNTSECLFAESLDGVWYLFDDYRKDKVTIHPHMVDFQKLGMFYCKSKHWSEEHYKTLSIFSNGCRPRYSCLEIFRSNPSTLKYRLSRSSLSDRSFSLCKFIDDPSPVGDNVRSSDLKTLIGANSIVFGRCGLGLLVHINLTILPGIHCDGTLTDIQMASCTIHDKLTLSLHHCPAFSQQILRCEALHAISSHSALLVTNSSHSLHQCFMVGFYHNGDKVTWNIELESVQCSTHKVLPYLYQRTNLTGRIHRITSYADRIDHPCLKPQLDPETQHIKTIEIPPPASSTSTSIGHTTPISAGRHQHYGSRKRIRTNVVRSSAPEHMDFDMYIDYTSSSSASFITWRILLLKILYLGHIDFVIGIFVYLILV